MRIRKIAFGDANEAFVEDRLTPGINIIFSDDNNKGKTIVMQSALYAIGNEPIFPSTFEYKNYYHYIEIELDNGKTISVCRKGDSYVIKSDSGMSILDSVSELKRYLTRCGMVFPIIVKDNAPKMVDPVLLYQVFFVGQDKKDSSNIFNAGYYKKEDFWNLIYALAGIENADVFAFDADEVKSKVSALLEEKKVLLEQNKILKKSSPSMEIISQKQGNEAFETKVRKVESINKSIIDLKKTQNRALQRKTINERTLNEIRALNRTAETGDLYCLDCGSKRIGYSSGDKSYTFDISDTKMRRNISEAIEDKINAYQEEIDDCTRHINELQRQMQDLLREEEISLESIVMYRSTITTASEADTRIAEIDREIKMLKSQHQSGKQKSQFNQTKRESVKTNIIHSMIQFYKQVDPSGKLIFDDLFSSRSSVYSGCEATEFYLSKLYSLALILNHKYPIMMDYFRDGELSTEKETEVLRLFGDLPNQVIFSATLKEQELGKYETNAAINAIDYSVNAASHILGTKHVANMRKLLKPLMIRL